MNTIKDYFFMGIIGLILIIAAIPLVFIIGLYLLISLFVPKKYRKDLPFYQDLTGTREEPKFSDEDMEWVKKALDDKKKSKGKMN